MGPRAPLILEFEEVSEEKPLQLCLPNRSCKSLEFNVDDEAFSSFLLMTFLCLFQVGQQTNVTYFHLQVTTLTRNRQQASQITFTPK